MILCCRRGFCEASSQKNASLRGVRIKAKWTSNHTFTLTHTYARAYSWVDVMFAATDVREDLHMQPIRNNGHWVGISYLYFLSWIMIGSFFIMQLMVGVICDQFNEQKGANEAVGKGLFTTQAQEEWKNTLKFIQKMEPKRKLKPLNDTAFEYFYRRNEFDMFIMGCIAVNSFMMAINHLTISDGLTITIDVANYIFAAIFTFEFVAKVTAVGWKQYCRGPPRSPTVRRTRKHSLTCSLTDPQIPGTSSTSRL